MRAFRCISFQRVILPSHKLVRCESFLLYSFENFTRKQLSGANLKHVVNISSKDLSQLDFCGLFAWFAFCFFHLVDFF